MALLFYCDDAFNCILLYSGLLRSFIYVVCIAQNGCIPLILAAQKGHHECVSILLAHGAEVDKAGGVSALSAGYCGV